MPYAIEPGPHPTIVCLRLFGNISQEDMHIDEPLGLNAGQPRYVLMDASGMSLRLPRGFLDGATTSFFVNANLRHMALYTGSDMLDLLAKTIANLTHRRTQLSLHKSRDEALKYLLDQIDTATV